MSNILTRNKIVIAVLALVGIALVAMLVGVATATVAKAETYNFTRNLKVGMSGADVMQLQKLLNMGADTQVAASGAGSPGNETSYFGALTKAAVIKWQNKNATTVLSPVGLSSGTGYFGPASRGVASGTAVTTTPSTTTTTTTTTSTVPATGGALSVAAATQPVNGLAVQSAARVPFTKVTFTAGANDVTVSGVTVERVGLAVDSVLAGVVLLDENGTQLGIAKTLNSNHQTTVGDPFTVKAGTSRTMTIAGNTGSSLSSQAGQIIGLNVVAVNTNGTVSGSLPISGAMHTVNSSLSIGSITMSRGGNDPGSSQTKEIGTTGYTFSSVKVTAGSAEKVFLRSVRWNQTGTAGPGDWANLKTSVGGTSYDVTTSSDGRYYTSVFPGNGILIDKGFSVDVSIKGDILGGSSRTIDFDIAKRTDVDLKGETYGYGIIPPQTGSSVPTADTAAFSSSEDPWYDAAEVTVSTGTLSVSTDSNVAAGNVAINLANQTLGGFSVDVRGEPITVSSMVINVASTTGSGTGLLTNVSLVNGNGAVIAGPVDGVYVSALVQSITFTDAVTLPVGTTKIKLQGKISSGIGNNGTYIASFTPSTAWTSITGQTTGKSITATPASTVTASTMTIKSGSLTVNVSSQPVAQNVVAGATQFTFANYIFDASQSGEDVRLTSVPLYFDTNGTRTDLTKCQLYDGGTSITTGSNEKNPATTDTASSTTMTFDGGGLTVLKGTSKTLAMKCNVKSGVTTKYWWGIDAGQNASFTGVSGLSSGQTITETFTDTNGQVMTAVAGGSYTVAADTSAAYNYQAVRAGTNVALGAFRFTATASEDVVLKQIALQLGNTASNSPADLVGQKVTIWDGVTQVGTAQFGLSSGDNATSTLSTPVTVAKGGTKTLVVKGDLSAQDTVNGTPGAFLAVTYDGDNNGLNGNYATGADSGSTINGGTTSDVTTNGVRIFRNVPQITMLSNGGTLNANADLISFKITNPDPSRDLIMKKVSFTVATSNASVKGFSLFGDGIAADASGIDAIADAAAGSATLVQSVFDVTSAAKIVPAGSSKTYILKASTVTDVGTSPLTNSINITLLADQAFPSQTNLMGTVAEIGGTVASALTTASTTNNIVWSPFSTTTPEATSASENNLDWTNGYGLSGFPAPGSNFSTQTWTKAR